MPNVSLHLTRLQHFVGQLRDRWRRRSELEALDERELERLAAEFGMTPDELHYLVDQGADAAALLYSRLAALHITRADVERLASGLAVELERTCSCCDQKHVCKNDLDARPDAADWYEYCPNATELESVKRFRGRFLA